ncbi:MAG: amidohydrolase [Desulfobacteraceae bacterium]|nr:amidohydrolase [Desulfobacteraceae bacterium]
MIIDFHTHAFPTEIRDDRGRFFPEEPDFRLLYDADNARLAGVSEILQSMDSHGVDRSVIFGFPWHNMETTRNHNDYIIASVKKHPDRFVGFCCVDPLGADATMEVERCLDSGLSGVGELAFYHSGIDENCLDHLDPVMRVCADRQIPVMIHTNEPIGHQYPGKTPNTLIQIYSLIKRFPDNTLILAHWGAGIFFYTLLKKEIRSVLKNVYYDTAASPFLYDTAIYGLAKQLGVLNRVLMGSDFPLLSPQRYLDEIGDSGLDHEDRVMVMGQNAARLLGLEKA